MLCNKFIQLAAFVTSAHALTAFAGVKRQRTMESQESEEPDLKKAIPLWRKRDCGRFAGQGLNIQEVPNAKCYTPMWFIVRSLTNESHTPEDNAQKFMTTTDYTLHELGGTPVVKFNPDREIVYDSQTTSYDPSRRSLESIPKALALDKERGETNFYFPSALADPDRPIELPRPAFEFRLSGGISVGSDGKPIVTATGESFESALMAAMTSVGSPPPDSLTSHATGIPKSTEDDSNESH
eukprot:gene770-900_t